MSVVFFDLEGLIKLKIFVFLICNERLCNIFFFLKFFDIVCKIIEGCCMFYFFFLIKMSEYLFLFYFCLIIC